MDLKKRIFVVLACFILGCSVLFGGTVKELWNAVDDPLFEIYHFPGEYSRRYMDFTANISGSVSLLAKELRYSLNDGNWKKIESVAPRAPNPLFLIELSEKELSSGKNTLCMEAVSYLGHREKFCRNFIYDPSPVKLPVLEDWENTDLDVQDGVWETVCTGKGCRVRPVPGFEGYDRIIAVTGAIVPPFRISTDIVYRFSTGGSDWDYGFGVLSMWGGRPDRKGYSPRRGWNFALSWWYSRYQAVGMEFSYKDGGDHPRWVSTYRNLQLEKNVPYSLLIECRPVNGVNGKHLRYTQRMKWWKLGEDEPENWMYIEDNEGAELPSGEYAVALIAFHCQADFGPVLIEALSE